MIDHLSIMLTPGFLTTNDALLASMISNGVALLSDPLKEADEGILSRPTITTRSSQVLVEYFAESSMNLVGERKV